MQVTQVHSNPKTDATSTVDKRQELFTRPDNAPYTRHEAAEYLGLAYNTLRSMASRGKGPVFHKLGRKSIYLRAD